MRPLPWEPLPHAPDYVRGASLVRGSTTPIVDLARLLGDPLATRPTRLVTLRLPGQRRVGLLVDEVVGLRDRATIATESLPPLLRSGGDQLIEELGRLDGQLLAVLQTGSLVPDELWQMIPGEEHP